jgi:O-glycosyl hydrolase
VKIMIAEPSGWVNTYAATAMDDPTVAAEVGILASHAYSGTASFLTYSNVTDQHQWETEVSDFNPYDGSITSALTYATEIDQWITTAQVNAWFYWLLSAQFGFTDNEALTDVNGNVAKRA